MAPAVSVERAVEGLKEAFYANTVVYYILAASIVELIAAGIECDDDDDDLHDDDDDNDCYGYLAYAVAVGVVSTVLTLLHAILASFKPMVADKIAPYLSIFLVLWWIPGAGIPTFKKPFYFVGNGYFACWVAFLSSLVFFQRTGLALIAGTRRPGEASGASSAHLKAPPSSTAAPTAEP